MEIFSQDASEFYTGQQNYSFVYFFNYYQLIDQLITFKDSSVIKPSNNLEYYVKYNAPEVTVMSGLRRNEQLAVTQVELNTIGTWRVNQNVVSKTESTSAY